MSTRTSCRLTLLVLFMVFSCHLLAGPDILGPCTGDIDLAGNYRVFRMVGSNDGCPLPPTTIPLDIEYDCRNTTVTLYQATGSITFGQGFQTADGESFTAVIVAPAFGVPQATNLTGTADANMNWTQMTTFDENGNIIGDSKDFFDDNGRKIQMQDKTFYRAGATALYTHVLASQIMRDAFGRDAATTLMAPIDYADFSYRPNFLLHNTSNAVYNHQNFDLSSGGDNTNSPDPIWDASSGTPVKGTLAWYYSQYNSWEPYTPETSYPYTRQTYYQDGTGNKKRSAQAGDQLRMGLGREQTSYIAPVANELDFYLQVRNKFFATTEAGALPASLAGQSMLQIARDVNGTEMIKIQDRSGNTLMTARAGSGMAVANTVTVGAPGSSDMNIYYFKLMAAGAVGITGGSYTLYDMTAEQTVSFSSGSTLGSGYYKLVNTGTTALTLTYGNSYADVSYNFYNQKGQLMATIAPEGTKKLYGSPGLASYTTRSSVPFISLFGYDLQGRMISSIDPNKGTCQFFYRKDGKIRFSQNAVQAVTGSYSYTNYDVIGRAVESGQYDGSAIAFGSAGMTAILENTDPGGGLTSGTTTDVTKTVYDLPDNSHGLAWLQDVANLSTRVSLTKRYSSIVNNTPGAANLVSATWYNYDEEGKTSWMIRYIAGLGSGTGDAASYKKTDYVYDVLGHLTKRIFQAGQPDAFTHIYDYDPANKQIWHVYTSIGTASPVLQATYIYNLTGELKRVELGTNLQGIDYTYTLQGNLKSINNSNKAQDPGGDGSGNGFSADAFGEVLDYFAGDYKNDRIGVASINGVNISSISGNPLPDSYTGNIKVISWYSEKPASSGLDDNPRAYVFQYDPKYQFTNSTWGTLSFSGATPSFSPMTSNQERVLNPADNTPAYDGNGNIQYLQRTDGNGTTSDAFQYQYGNNNDQLSSVINTLTSQPYASYSYDQMGQVKAETLADGTQLTLVYDVTGKVTKVYRGAGNTPVASFVYDELGKRIKKLSYNTSGQLIQVTFYVGDVIYTQAVTGGTNFGLVVAQEYLIEGSGRIGTYFAQIPVYAYELTDHLGNVRAVVAPPAGSTAYDVRSSSDYYPFGGTINPGGTSYRYGYQGQNAEKDAETGWNAFELRMYDSRIGRWLQYDPKGQFNSPYIGMGNDPVRGTDPDGGETYSTIINEAGKVVGGDINDGDKGIYQVNGLTKENFDFSKMADYKAEGQLVGQSLFMTSFYFTENSDHWRGTIDLNSYAARDWLNQKIFTNTPSTNSYMNSYDKNGKSVYDYKEYGRPAGMDYDEYHYRGSQISPGVYVSARDVGNIAAGYVAGYEGHWWWTTSVAFRAKQWRQDNPGKGGSYWHAFWGGGQEPAGTRDPEIYGWELGNNAYEARPENKAMYKMNY